MGNFVEILKIKKPSDRLFVLGLGAALLLVAWPVEYVHMWVEGLIISIKAGWAIGIVLNLIAFYFLHRFDDPLVRDALKARVGMASAAVAWVLAVVTILQDQVFFLLEKDPVLFGLTTLGMLAGGAFTYIIVVPRVHIEGHTQHFNEESYRVKP